MRRLLSRARAQIAGFGIRPLTFSDLSRECDVRGIILGEIGMTELHGLAWTNEGRTHICLNKFLYPEAKLFAGLHELAHSIFHVTDQQMLRSRGCGTNDDRTEAEADAIAVVAMLPFPIDGVEAETSLEWKRFELFERYGI